jgi:hypothetical protein
VAFACGSMVLYFFGRSFFARQAKNDLQKEETSLSFLSFRHQWRSACVPIGYALVGIAGAQQRGLIEGPADQLKPDRQSLAEAAWNHQAWHASQAAR